MRKFFLLFCVIIFLFGNFKVKADTNEITAKSYILTDSHTGKVLLENNPDEKLPPASITKIMTMLLTMEAIDEGLINENDLVTVSKNAAIKTGSHVYLSEGEIISVDELLKCVAVASGNDASIALSEYVAGSQEKFVEKMNEKAKALGMTNTNFVNCNGLDDENHYSTARDISIMTNELLKHEKIFNYTTIWMDSIRNGKFGLSNTNKLIRFYEGANGMKTGSTSKAGACLSATAKRNGMQLTAVVLSAASSKDRFSDASDLLNYGFNNYENVALCKKGETIKYISVNNGMKDMIKVVCKDTVNRVVEKNVKNGIVNKVEINEHIDAPIKKGDEVGKIKYLLNGDTFEEVIIVADESVDKITFSYLINLMLKLFINII